MRPVKFIDPPTQTEVYECNEYLALTRPEMITLGCPAFLMRILNEIIVPNKESCIQIRTQDFRIIPYVTGAHWHTDISVLPIDSTKRICKPNDPWNLKLVSFGDVCETEFQTGETALPNQLIEYNSTEIHRASPIRRTKNFRMVIVVIECNEYLGGGIVRPSIKERECEYISDVAPT